MLTIANSLGIGLLPMRIDNKTFIKSDPVPAVAHTPSISNKLKEKKRKLANEIQTTNPTTISNKYAILSDMETNDDEEPAQSNQTIAEKKTREKIPTRNCPIIRPFSHLGNE